MPWIDDGGCVVCRQEINDHRFKSIRLIAEAKTTLLKVYRCDACGAWYDLDLGGRLYDRTEEDAQDSLRRIRLGL